MELSDSILEFWQSAVASEVTCRWIVTTRESEYAVWQSPPGMSGGHECHPWYWMTPIWGEKQFYASLGYVVLLGEDFRQAWTATTALAIEHGRMMSERILPYSYRTRTVRQVFGLIGKTFKLISTRLSNSALRGSTRARGDRYTHFNRDWQVE